MKFEKLEDFATSCLLVTGKNGESVAGFNPKAGLRGHVRACVRVRVCLYVAIYGFEIREIIYYHCR